MQQQEKQQHISGLTLSELISDELFGTGVQDEMRRFSKFRDQLNNQQRFDTLQKFKTLPENNMIRPAWACYAKKEATPLEMVNLIASTFADCSPVLAVISATNGPTAIMLSWCLAEDLPDSDSWVMSSDRSADSYLMSLSYLYSKVHDKDAELLTLSHQRPEMQLQPLGADYYRMKIMQSGRQFRQKKNH